MAGPLPGVRAALRLLQFLFVLQLYGRTLHTPISLSGVASYLSQSFSASGLPDDNVTHVSSAHSHFFCPQTI